MDNAGEWIFFLSAVHMLYSSTVGRKEGRQMRGKGGGARLATDEWLTKKLPFPRKEPLVTFYYILCFPAHCCCPHTAKYTNAIHKPWVKSRATMLTSALRVQKYSVRKREENLAKVCIHLTTHPLVLVLEALRAIHLGASLWRASGGSLVPAKNRKNGNLNKTHYKIHLIPFYSYTTTFISDLRSSIVYVCGMKLFFE